MIHLDQAIVVEGRYDKNTLSQIVDAPIFTTDGFGIMKDREMLLFLRETAKRRGLIILTDPDGAGFVIRNYLRGALPKENVYHAYVPDIHGKEKRKEQPGKEGLLGVEGMSPEALEYALRHCGIPELQSSCMEEKINKTDLYTAGLNGTENSAYRRAALKKELNLPEHLSTNGLLDALNILFRRSDFLAKYGVSDD